MELELTSEQISILHWQLRNEIKSTVESDSTGILKVEQAFHDVKDFFEHLCEIEEGAWLYFNEAGHVWEKVECKWRLRDE